MTGQSRRAEHRAEEHLVQLSLIDPYHRNHGLFSNHYLDERVSEDPFWQSLVSQAGPLRQTILAIWRKTSPAQKANTSESGLEDALIRPILKALGHSYSLQRALEVVGKEARTPDYIFFPSEAAKAKAEGGSKSTFLDHAIAVGDAKRWGISLDKKAGDGFNMQSPSYQIDYYIRLAGVPWGILTNGRFWRLYHRDTSLNWDTYYEVDLEQLIAHTEEPDAVEKFLYFAAFFCKDALLPDPATRESFLDRALKGSAQYAKGIGDKLKGNVYEVLRLLCEGFLSLPSNGLTPADMAAIRENAFVAIYRLLFIFYAEARGFLPLRNAGYATSSLGALARDIAGKALDYLSTQQTNYWDRLQNLFHVIDQGDPSVGVMPYNGGLFSNEGEHSALARWKISDRYMAQAIDLLARVQEEGAGKQGFVDYSDLSVRELGTIYEGLLEQQPRYAEVDTAVIKQDKREVYVPANSVKSPSGLLIYAKGSVYLATDKGERKTTGSYYTPDYIVKYIVSHALDPLLEEVKQANPDGGQKLADAILSLKVLDPAMGSGHFLVEATDYLARAYAEAMAPSDHETGEEDIRLARRRVVERCVYGVDLNPLAVELAKLSLWLYTVSENKPLNFLDHHLRCGNSLIGAEIDKLEYPPEKKRAGAKKGETIPAPNLFTHYLQASLSSAVSNYLAIERMPSDTLEQVKQKEQVFANVRDQLRRYQQVADIWTSIFFGNKVPESDYANAQAQANPRGLEWNESDVSFRLSPAWNKKLDDRSQTAQTQTWNDIEAKPWFGAAIALAQRHRFFHWELEFPEVFFDEQGQRKENPGFDAVIGNPPWASYSGREGQTLDPAESDYYSAIYSSFRGWRALHTIFGEKAWTLTKRNGWHSFIAPDQVGYLNNYLPFRQLFANSNLAEVAYMGEGVFEGVVSPALIYVAAKRPIKQVAVKGREGVEQNVPFEQLGSDPYFRWSADPKRFIWNRLESYSMHFDKEFADPGVHTGNCSKALIQTKPMGRCAPILEGTDVQRYSVSEPRAFLRLDYQPKQGEYFTIRNYDTYKTVQLVIRQTAPRVIAARHIGTYFRNNLLAFYEDKTVMPDYVLAILNSSLIQDFYRSSFPEASQQVFPQVKVSYLRRLPIRRIAFTTPEQHRDSLVEQGKRLYAEYLGSGGSGSFLAFIDQRLPQKPDGTPDMQNEQSDVVHDLLAFFAGEMTRLHKEEQAEAQVFLDWLQRYVRVSLGQLAGKTTVEHYWEVQAGTDALIDVLVKNRKAIQNAKGPDVTTAAVQAKIAQECDPAIRKLRGLERQITLTDRLIDQTVYRLYGLTAEEIAAVQA